MIDCQRISMALARYSTHLKEPRYHIQYILNQQDCCMISYKSQASKKRSCIHCMSLILQQLHIFLTCSLHNELLQSAMHIFPPHKLYIPQLIIPSSWPGTYLQGSFRMDDVYQQTAHRTQNCNSHLHSLNTKSRPLLIYPSS
jgi:hypothetical protein